MISNFWCFQFGLGEITVFPEQSICWEYNICICLCENNSKKDKQIKFSYFYRDFLLALIIKQQTAPRVDPPIEKCPKSWRGPSKSWEGPDPPDPPSGCALKAHGLPVMHCTRCSRPLSWPNCCTLLQPGLVSVWRLTVTEWNRSCVVVSDSVSATPTLRPLQNCLARQTRRCLTVCGLMTVMCCIRCCRPRLITICDADDMTMN